MSYTEYISLFKKAQKKGKYYMFIFDIKNSRTYGEQLALVEKISRVLINNIYKRIEDMEKQKGIEIIHKVQNKKRFIDNEPFQFGDLFGFTIIRDTINKKEVYQIYEEEKQKLNIYWDFNIMDGYYETDDYKEGKIKYYRGYCIQQLEELSKIENIEFDKKKK